MKQPILFYLLAWGFMHPAAAQITITNSVFPVVGDTLHYAFGNQPGAINQIFTPPGGFQTWNLSNLQPTQYWNQIMKDPATGMKSAAFPAASLLFNPVNSSSEAYLQVTGSQVLDMGYYGLDPLGLGLTLLFDRIPDLEQSWAPVNFLDIHQSSSNVLTAFDAPIAPPVLLNLVPTADSFRIRITQQRISTIDAFGTMAIPGGSFDVLRKKQTEYRSTAVDVKVAPLGWIDISTIGGQQLLPLGTDTITTFHFLNDVSKEAIAICTLNTAQNMVTGVQYKVMPPPTGTITPTFNTVLSIYPNPVQHTLKVHFTDGESAGAQLQLLNAQGRLVLEQTVEAATAVKDISIPVDHLPSGNYVLILLRNGVAVDRARVVKM
ncbi:MAG: T9SS type A sorting domain-containing protein [Lewinellaceae bacterium]|nr:T9SS type A sorting domain-containing protein [Saprospiraceae bacterium]MCB9329454.1 T9SS type A sorting domain-containing protein [Lewinellaceae bacterium]